MGSKQTSKKSISKIPPKTEERIIAISLKYPELGARRLVPELKKKRISVSATTIQSILRRQGLQNREKRLAKIKQQVQKPKSLPKKSSAKTPHKIAERIVELSLKYPEHGARRLVAELQKKKIVVSASTVYAILKRRGLQTRDKRLTQIKKRTKKSRKPKLPPKKPSPKITDEVAEHIYEISLQNTDLGAGRLVPLLEKEGIFLSSSAVYRILKRHGLQTREKRMAKAAENVADPAIIPKAFPEKIPHEVEDRIVEISLQNPECGARRLMPLLQQEEIVVSASAVYRIMKRNDLENQHKRLLKLEARQALEIPPALEVEGPEPVPEQLKIDHPLPVDEVPEPVLEPAVAVPIPAEDETPEQAPIPEPAVAAPAKSERPPVRKTPLKTIKKRGHWVFYPLYLLLFILLGYLGLHAVQTIQYARLDTQAIQIDDSVAVGIPAKTLISAQPLDGYRQIWERNLFNTGSVKVSDLKEKIALARLAPAKKGLGLELVGTVVADDPRMSRAIIDNRSIRKQEVYREGENAGKVKIKKILRNNVVITTADGDELLTVEIKESGKSTASAQSPYIGSRSSSAQRASGTRQQRVRTSSIRLKRDELVDSFADIDGLMEQMKITAYKSGDEAAGFRLGRITRDSVLRKMGLRSRDVIVGIDDETITSPDQASDFFKRLADGGEVTIKLKRRRRTRQIKLNIE
jgi:type II secretion system protein C